MFKLLIVYCTQQFQKNKELTSQRFFNLRLEHKKLTSPRVPPVRTTLTAGVTFVSSTEMLEGNNTRRPLASSLLKISICP